MKTTGLGHLFKRGNVYYLTYQVNGKKQTISLKTKNEKEAIKEQKKVMGTALNANTTEKVIMAVAEARQVHKSKKILLDTVWDKYDKNIYRANHSATTLANHKRVWMALKKWLNEKYPIVTCLDQITKSIAEEYTAFLWGKNITGDTFTNKMASIKMIYKTLLEETKTPFDYIKKETGTGISHTDFTFEQMAKIHEVLKYPDLDVEDKEEFETLCYILQYTGLRLCDAILLRWKSIDIEKNNIEVEPIKTKRIRRKINIPIHPEFKGILEKLNKDSEFVVPNLAKRYMTCNTTIKTDFLEILTRAGLGDKETRERGSIKRKYGFHSFRTSFATIMANATPPVPVTVLADMMGDNIETVQKYYVNIHDATKINAINNLGQVKPVSEVETLTNRIQNAIKLLESAKISKGVKAELFKILQG